MTFWKRMTWQRFSCWNQIIFVYKSLVQNNIKNLNFKASWISVSKALVLRWKYWQYIYVHFYFSIDYITIFHVKNPENLYNSTVNFTTTVASINFFLWANSDYGNLCAQHWFLVWSFYTLLHSSSSISLFVRLATVWIIWSLCWHIGFQVY